MYDLTCDDKFLGVAEFASFLHGNSALIVSRIGRPGGVEFIHDRVFLGGGGVDRGIVLPDLEGVGEVPGIAVWDVDLADDFHWRPTLNGGAWLDGKANPIYNERCKAMKRKYQPVSVSCLCKTNIRDSPEHKITAKVY